MVVYHTFPTLQIWTIDRGVEIPIALYSMWVLSFKYGSSYTCSYMYLCPVVMIHKSSIASCPSCCKVNRELNKANKLRVVRHIPSGFLGSICRHTMCHMVPMPLSRGVTC